MGPQRHAALDRQGVTVLSDMVYRPWSLEGKRIETIIMRERVPAMDIGLAWRQGAELTPAMRLFRSHFSEAYQTPQSRLSR